MYVFLIFFFFKSEHNWNYVTLKACSLQGQAYRRSQDEKEQDRKSKGEDAVG